MKRALAFLSLLAGCVPVVGAGLTTRDGHRGVVQIGVQSSIELPIHVGPLIGLAYRRTADGNAAVLQGGIRIEKSSQYIIMPTGPHGRIAVQHAFAGEDSATGVVAAAGYHWEIYNVELEYAREAGDNDVSVIFGIDILKILASGSDF